jgi:PAS domain S-box-containing protein
MPAESGSEEKQTRAAVRLIHGNAIMAELIRGFDWTSTDLGPVHTWSDCLLCSVNIMLGCSFPSLIFWGEQMVQLYNDAFIPQLAEKHPADLGGTARECWQEAWHIVGPLLERVLFRGETIHEENALIPILRDGQLQDVRWTFSYSPIYSPDDVVAGIMVIAQDVTRETTAVQELRASEARARRVLESIGDAVIVTDAETRITRMNPVAEGLTGWKLKDALGKPLADVFKIVNESTRLTVESPADKVRLVGRIVGLANHTILISRDGVETAIDDSGAPIFDDNGVLTGIVVVFRDITERRAAERERERITQQLVQVMGATTDAIVSVNRDWVMTYLNPAAEQIYASPDRRVLGRNVWEAFPNAVYEGSAYLKYFYRAMDERIPGAFEEYYPEPLNAWLRIEVYPTAEGIVTFSRDVTREREDREALRQKSEEAERQRAEIETLYRTAPIGLALFDTEEFRYLRLNDRQAEFFGLKPEDVLGKRLTEMAPIDELEPLFKQVLEGVPVVNYPLEGSLVTNPDQHRYWTVSYFPVLGPDGSVQGITAASLEVTQQKKTELALIQSEKLAVAGRLAASMAHEINNPLAAVTNLLYLASRSDDQDEIKKYIAIAERELRRVAAISNQTLRFHKQSTGPREISYDELIESVVSIYQGRILNSGVQVEERRRADVPVQCFEGEIRQVLSNLVSNAIDAMQPRGGRLLLRSRVGTNWKTGKRGLVFTVADTGTGISREAMHRIFEPFYTTKDLGGTGLGLWVSQEIVNRHGGSLAVRSSRAHGKSGTVFALFLPFDAVSR